MDRRTFVNMASAVSAAAWATGLVRPRASLGAALDAALGARGMPRGVFRKAVPVLPSKAQAAWQRRERAIFLHFGVNTFTGKEWGEGKEDPSIFAPAALDARQWVRAAKQAGFASVVLTAKHHDGFCLWPSAATTHSVVSSPFRGGRGDVVREFTEACRAEGVGAGLYLSPWDRHEPSYGDTPRYNDYYERQLTELLTRYGALTEVWFDGANGEGPNGRRQQYDWPRVHATVRRLQPNALMFSDAGPDIRWIGNERGVAGDPNWCTVDPAAVPYPGVDGPQIIAALQHGDPAGTVWRPGEADVSIRPGWFWRSSEDAKIRSVDNLEQLYYSSVGRNANLLLNVPPSTQGLLGDADVRALSGFGARIAATFATDLAVGAVMSATQGGATAKAAADPDPDHAWFAGTGVTEASIEFALEGPVRFDVIELREPIAAFGQTVESHEIAARTDGAWMVIARGTTIGNKRLHRMEPLTADAVRVTVRSARGDLRLSRLGLYARPR